MLLLLPITQGHEWGWSSPSTIGCFAGAAAMAAVWVLVERQVPEPLVDMRMFAHRPVLFANLAGLLVGYGTFVFIIGVSYLVQMPSRVAGYGFDASVLRASVEYLLPSTVVSLLAAPVGGQWVRHTVRGWSWRWPRRAAPRASPGSPWTTAALRQSSRQAPSWALPSVSVTRPCRLIIVAAVPQRESGIANGINSISRSTGSAIGSAVITTVLASKSVGHLPAGSPALPAESQFTLSFVLAGAAFALIALVAWFGLRHIQVAQHHAAETAADRGAVTESEVLRGSR